MAPLLPLPLSWHSRASVTCEAEPQHGQDSAQTRDEPGCRTNQGGTAMPRGWAALCSDRQRRGHGLVQQGCPGATPDVDTIDFPVTLDNIL